MWGSILRASLLFIISDSNHFRVAHLSFSEPFSPCARKMGMVRVKAFQFAADLKSASFLRPCGLFLSRPFREEIISDRRKLTVGKSNDMKAPFDLCTLTSSLPKTPSSPLNDVRPVGLADVTLSSFVCHIFA